MSEMSEQNAPATATGTEEETDQRATSTTGGGGGEGTTDGLSFDRYFTKKGVHPYEEIDWVESDIDITNDKGEVIFRQEGVEHPDFWSQRAVRIVASKYFYGDPDKPEERESSMREIVDRVAKTMRKWGEKDGFFATEKDARIFEEELTWLLINQNAAFNSPVWFNCGHWHENNITSGEMKAYRWDPEKEKVVEVRDEEGPYKYPQCSACFILDVQDDMESILQHAVEEGRLFKYGSGTGTNFSSIRSSKEPVSGGGVASGPLSFMRIYDSVAGSIRSGGRTRRSAKMDILNIEHPDVEDFIWAKKKQEDIARILVEEHGYAPDMDGLIYQDTVRFQNSNQSVRLNGEFMEAYENDQAFWTKEVTTGDRCEKYEAQELMEQICESAWDNAEPGVQFNDTINDWHTCKNSGEINGTNPCSEYIFLDNTACNLASLRLTQYLDENDDFDVEKFKKAVRIIFTAQELIVDNASYPTEPIAKGSHDFRTIGLGYADVGAMLMKLGIPYDSKKGTDLVGAITGLMTGEAYRVSSEISEITGPFPKYEKNEEPMLDVIDKHRELAEGLSEEMGAPGYAERDKYAGQDWSYIAEASQEVWNRALERGREHGYRNAQASVIAPTGTISFYMDCDTTGIEPDYSLVKFKRCSGGGFIKIVNQMVPSALRNLGYTEAEIEDIFEHMAGTQTLDSDCPVNWSSLKESGMTENELECVESALEHARDLQQAFTPEVLGDEVLDRFEISEEDREDPQFDFLSEIGFSDEEISTSSRTITGTFTIEGAPHIKNEHLKVFDCANKCGEGERAISPMGHVNMMASAQRWVSGGISKTVNLPADAEVEDIEDIYYKSWKKGVKCIAVFRADSKGASVMSTGSDDEEADEDEDAVAVSGPNGSTIETESEAVQYYQERVDELEQELEEAREELESHGGHKPIRKRLPDERESITHKFSIGGHEGYVTVGKYDDGSPGEVFITMAKEGSVVSGLMDTVATSTSIALQYGVPLEVLVKKFTHTRFEPSGWTNNQDIPLAKSVMDYIFRWLGNKYLPDDEAEDAEKAALQSKPPKRPSELPSVEQKEQDVYESQSDSPPCSHCGSIMINNGTCYACPNCGSTTGCS